VSAGRKIGLAVRELHRGEHGLARQLRAVAARHHANSDIRYVAPDLAEWSENHLRELSCYGTRHGLWLPAQPPTEVVTGRLRTRFGQALRRREPASMLADLRRVHLCAAAVSLDWELLGQAAQVVKDEVLLELTSRWHPQTLRQMRWTNTMLKQLSPQALTD
jgi:hypothetical protein